MAALNRGSQGRFAATIWPGYVDAMTTLLMVLIFVLTIFVVVQAMLRETITTQGAEIATQGAELTAQAETLSAQERRLADLGAQVGALSQALSASETAKDAEAARAAGLSADLDAARARLTAGAAELAATAAARDAAETARARLAADLAAARRDVASARTEIDAQAEAARLDAARREALEALAADLRRRAETGEAQAADLRSRLTAEESARLTEAEAARLLTERLSASDAELTAMTLSLEEQRRRAEETLTLLAAAEAAQGRLTEEARAQAARLTEAERQAALLDGARAELARAEALSAEGQRRVALLNAQVADLSGELSRLQGALDAAGEGQRAAELRVTDLGRQLNAALLVAAEEKDARLKLETEARAKAEAEAKDLARYKSEFFGNLSAILADRPGIRVVGDRFVFDSNVLFGAGEAVLSDEGRAQVANVAALLTEVAAEIPPGIDWVIRVDGHTDDLPLSGTGRYRDNWELSQGRALAVVRYMIDELGFPATRLAPTGFADTRPVADEATPEGRAQNRRIELKLTER